MMILYGAICSIHGSATSSPSREGAQVKEGISPGVDGYGQAQNTQHIHHYTSLHLKMVTTIFIIILLTDLNQPVSQ